MQSTESSKIFHEINEKVKPILISIEDEIQYNSLKPQSLGIDHNEKQLNRLKNQCILLKNLRNELRKQSISNRSILIEMEEYILLPLTLIMRKEISKNENSLKSQEQSLYTFSDSMITSHLIIQSCEFSCISEAAKSMSFFIENCYYKNDFYSSSSKSEYSTYISPLLKSQTIVSCLISCAMSLEYLEKQLHNREFAENALDGGEDCQKTIFNTIESIVKPFRLTESKHHITFNIANAINGNILAQLSKNCIDCILQSTHQNKDYQTNSIYNKPINSVVTVNKNNKTENRIRTNNNNISNDLSYHALKTFQTLILGFPVVEIWRSLLPGAFSSIFRVALTSLHSSQSSLKLAELSLLVLSNLLTVTLKQINPKSNQINNTKNQDKNTDNISKKSSELNHFLKWKNSLSSKDHNLYNQCENFDDLTFLQEVNSRLPGPLCVLLHLLPIQRAKKVKEAGIQLCRVILVDTHEMWLIKYTRDENTREPLLLTTAMELCLAFSNDTIASVANNANITLNLHRSSLKLKNKWKKHQNTYLAPRILQLIEELPALVLSGKEINATNGINLLNGYLSLVSSSSEINPNKDNDLTYFISGSSIGSSFASEDVTLLIKNSISTIIELDFDSFSSDWLKICPLNDDMNTVISKTDHLIEQRAKNSSYNFLHFRSLSSMTSVVKLLRLLGSHFGLKRCVLFIDKCIAEIYEECNEARKHGTMLYGKGQHKWLRKRVSCVIMAKEILLGCINNETKYGYESIEKKSIVDQNSYFPKIKIMELLCKSILPVIIEPTIWKLPTSVEALNQKNEENNDERNYCLPLNDLFLNSKPNFQSLYYDNKITDFVKISLTTLHGNAHMLAQLLDLVGIISLASGNDFQTFLPLILLPFLEKTSNYGNHPHVKNAAIQTLNHIAKAVNVRDISELFLFNFDYLVDSAVCKLSTTYTDQNATMKTMTHTLYTIEVLLEQIVGQNLQQKQSSEAKRLETDLSYTKKRTFEKSLCSLTQSILSNFDQKYVVTSKKSSIEESNKLHLAMVRVLRVVLKALHISHRQVNDHSTVNQQNIPAKKKIYYSDLLSNFGRLSNEGTDVKQDKKNNIDAQSGFNEYHAKKKESFVDDFDENDDLSSSEVTSENKELSDNINTVKEIMKRMAFFLSSSTLQTKIAAFDTLVDGFRLLAAVSNIDNLKENENRTNYLLPTLSEIWPSIKSQLLSASQLIMNNQVPHSNLLHEQTALSSNGTDASSSAYCIESGFKLINSLIELDGDFLVDRFQSDVYPIISKLFRHSLKMKSKKQKSSNPNLLRKNDFFIQKSKDPYREHNIKHSTNFESRSLELVLVAALDCIQRTFINASCGVKLAYIIPDLGYLILPMLADENSIGIAAESALKSLLAIDCSSLLRGLILMSGQKMPIHPLMDVNENEINYVDKLKTLSSKRALILLVFIDNLNE